jgi:t-SNARE complex subunit (syntaxin)
VAALFQDLAVLVQHQSEMLDSIEENVETAGA